MKSKRSVRVLSLLLTACCLFIGYQFYRINHRRDPFVWASLSLGLLGIMLSVLRNAKNPEN
jgi:hypothetical protein